MTKAKERAKAFQDAGDAIARAARLRRETLLRVSGAFLKDDERCGDRDCIFGHPGGMSINMGCRCTKRALGFEKCNPTNPAFMHIRNLEQMIRRLAAEVAGQQEGKAP